MPSGVTLMLAGFRSRWTMPLLVRRLKRVGNLPRDRERLGDRNRAARDAIGERLALDQFHHENRDAAALRGRRWPRCWDDSMTPKLPLHAETGSPDRGLSKIAPAES